MVVKWEAAFRGLVGDGQFAVLGVVLLGVLGRVVRVLGVLGRMKGRNLAVVDQEDLGIGEVGEDLGTVVERAMGGEFGEVVERDEHEGETEDDVRAPVETNAQPSEEFQDTRSTAPTPRSKPCSSTKKKRKRTGDAIDDLFAGLA